MSTTSNRTIARLERLMTRAASQVVLLDAGMPHRLGFWRAPKAWGWEDIDAGRYEEKYELAN